MSPLGAVLKRLLSEDRCLLVAEVSQAHEGSLGQAHAFIDAIAKTGAYAVKFQTHIAEAESTSAEPWRVRFSFEDVSRFDYWKRMEFDEEQWRGLRSHAEECGLKFISSPFSVEAVDLLRRVGVAAWKIASGEVGNQIILERMASAGIPLFVSTGMSPLEEIDKTVEWSKKKGLEIAVLQCTSAYPCPPEKVGLNLIPLYRKRYGCSIGLSDHSGTIFSGLAAATLGIAVLEVHVVLSREMFGPDVPVSLTTSELKQLVEGVRYIERMRAHPVEKDSMAEELQPMRKMFTKSLVTRRQLPVGTVLQPEHLTLKKPGTGISSDRLQSLVGRRLRRSVEANQILQEEDVELAG